MSATKKFFLQIDMYTHTSQFTPLVGQNQIQISFASFSRLLFLAICFLNFCKRIERETTTTTFDSNAQHNEL